MHESEGVFYAVGHERGHITKDGERMELRIRTSRIYQFLQGQWRQVHHHGSIDNPELLARYQAMAMQK
ncbi:MAG: nuclear transport factor 2 family protein [Pseudomonadota bacterium]|nr:nuclear transport factor 2 family protein [Pseudomonadota bacterium]